MGRLDQFMEGLDLQHEISLTDIPEIDLYMDQVIQLFENHFKDTKRNEDEKILTKTMINNYAKAKLFFPIKNKKYSKEHLLLISLIYQLKGSLSISDIKETFQGINKMIVEEESFELEPFYHSYLQLSKENTVHFKKDIQERAAEVDKEVAKLETEKSDYLRKVMLITSLAHISNLYRRAAEQLVDEIMEEQNGKKEIK
ncbi:hypothetical protein J27TS8_12460 [Robertmurraya siralis]|uniref:DUF1836 domain-containing protein n=1 Tax=Robertmurraya siralis TaxID=77777 RepID=A0A919WGA1_9BACI|nr:DUF1836 domain-containing protein [Robertmurraya siralis]GIN61253.1 hypothetical protein J27TS8_12460 [Robertmurraya siralis]